MLSGSLIPQEISVAVVVMAAASFVRAFTTLSIVRVGIGLTGMGFGLVTALLAIMLSSVVLEPVVEKACDQSVHAKSTSSGAVRESAVGTKCSLFSMSPREARVVLTPFFKRNTDPSVTESLRVVVDTGVVDTQLSASVRDQKPTLVDADTKSDAVKKRDDTSEAHGDAPSTFAALSFMVSELSLAFSIGLTAIIPFVLVDLLVAIGLVATHLSVLPHYAVAFPLKLLLFFAADGWTLLSVRLLSGYVME